MKGVREPCLIKNSRGRRGFPRQKLQRLGAGALSKEEFELEKKKVLAK
jgi:hypothetical protein